MKKYWIIFATAVKSTIEYRLNFFIGLILPFISLAGNLALWGTIAEGTESVSKYVGGTIIWYFVWVFIVRLLFKNMYGEIRNEIHEGKISGTVLKPISYFLKYLFNYWGNTIQMFLIFLISSTVAYIIQNGGLDFWIMPFVLSVVLAHTALFSYNFIFGVMSFWFKAVHGFYHMYGFFAYFLSGAVIPLSLVGSIFGDFYKFLPFRVEVDIPMKILYSGNILEILGLLGIQVIWIVIFSAIGQFLYKKGSKKLEAVGI